MLWEMWVFGEITTNWCVESFYLLIVLFWVSDFRSMLLELTALLVKNGLFVCNAWWKLKGVVVFRKQVISMVWIVLLDVISMICTAIWTSYVNCSFVVENWKGLIWSSSGVWLIEFCLFVTKMEWLYMYYNLVNKVGLVVSLTWAYF